MHVFTSELAELAQGHAAASGSVLVQLYDQPYREAKGFFLSGSRSTLELLGLAEPPKIAQCFAIFPITATFGAKAQMIVPVDWPNDLGRPVVAERAEYYGSLATGHAIAFDIRSRLVMPTGPAVTRKWATPRLQLDPARKSTRVSRVTDRFLTGSFRSLWWALAAACIAYAVCVLALLILWVTTGLAEQSPVGAVFAGFAAFPISFIAIAVVSRRKAENRRLGLPRR